MYDFDLLVLGSGPGGQKAAIAAAKLGRRTAVVEKTHMLGGVCINTGTIPSKTLREAVLYLTGLNQRELYGASYRVKEEITVADLGMRTQHVMGREIQVIRSQLARNHVTLLQGTGRFLDAHTIGVTGEEERKVTAEKIVIATGTSPARPSTVEFDDRTVIDSDAILHLDRVPETMVVVGAGVIGIEYASMFAALGTKVTVVERRERMLEFCDLEIVEALKYHLRDLAVTFRFGESVAAVERRPRGALTLLESGKKIPADCVMYSAGRQGKTAELCLEAAGPVRRRSRPDQGRRRLRHPRPAHLRRRRRDRLSRAGGHLDGAGQARRAARLRRARPRHERTAADRDLHHPGDQLRREVGGRADPREDPVRGGHLPLQGAGQGPDHRRLVRHAQAAGLLGGQAAARGPRVRHGRH
ncbi:thioredoxin reductase [Nonomuraea dietziae]|uniref:Thioredoxin reductase n=1 Tax=Nonomuraea dietziae TaxID=65515 RepID=A0A7W5YN31_9ACTN|nr:thioredoxin reductase [Nonomuraea dietziae]